MDSPLDGRFVVLGVTGGIAAYKAIEICRILVDSGAHVAPVMTKEAERFVGALTFSSLASEPTRTGLWDEDHTIPHTWLGQRADVVVVAPATARFISAYATGYSDSLLTATVIATRAPVVVCPAMHTEMWEHQATQENIATLRRRGVEIVGPAVGRLAGGDLGAGRLAEPAEIVRAVTSVLLAASGGSGATEGTRRGATARDLEGLRVLVTAGGTREPIDPVRFITNRSSGKQGHAVAAAAVARGANVTLVTTVGIPTPGVTELVRVETALEMEQAVLARSAESDLIVMAAAVADFRPKHAASHKIHKLDGTPDIVLEPTTDILSELSRRRPPGQVLVGFAAETEDAVQRATRKLETKGLDMIVCNDVSQPGAGFDHDTNSVTILSRREPPLSASGSKSTVAHAVLDTVTRIRTGNDAPGER